MEYLTGIAVTEVISTVFFTFLGLALLGACWWVIDRITHFSISKEIEQKQNSAVAILMGALFLSLAIIIAAVIRS